LPRDRSKPSQLDLLAIEPPASIAAAPSKAPGPDAAALPQEVPSRPNAEPSRPPTGEPRLVSLSALCEGPDPPPTEVPPVELQKSAEDIHQHGILQPIVVQPADVDGRYRIHFGAKRFRPAGLAGLEQVPGLQRDERVCVRRRGQDTAGRVDALESGAGRGLACCRTQGGVAQTRHAASARFAAGSGPLHG